MAKLLKKRIKSCQDCPYCRYDGHYSMSEDSGWNCEHDEGSANRIADDGAVDEWEQSRKKNKGPHPLTVIPEGCPLPDAETIDKSPQLGGPKWPKKRKGA